MVKVSEITTTSDIVGIQKDIGYIKESVAEIKQSVKELAGVYITKLEADDNFRANRTRIEALEKASNMWKFLSPTISAALSGTLVFLLLQYLQHLK